MVDFYAFCSGENRNEYSTDELRKFTTSPYCVSTLPDKSKNNIKPHILKSIITVRSIEPVVRSFRRKSSVFFVFSILGKKFFYKSSGRKSFTFPEI